MDTSSFTASPIVPFSPPTVELSIATSEWNKELCDTIARSAMLSSAVYRVRIFDESCGSSGVLITTRGEVNARHTRVAVTIPIHRLLDEDLRSSLALVTNLWSLVLLDTSESGYGEALDAVVAALDLWLRSATGLKKVSLPLDVVLWNPRILYKVSAVRDLDAVMLSPPSTPSVFVDHREELSRALVLGFDGFHHLRKISVSSEAISVDFCACLGRLQGLQKMEIIATILPASSDLQPVALGKFPRLQNLTVVGFLTDARKLVRALVHPKASQFHKLRITAKHLRHPQELRDTLRGIVGHCKKLKRLGIYILALHEQETKEWLVLDPLMGAGKLRKFRIEHPRPLPIVDRDIEALLQAFPSAKHISLNPRPSLPTWSGPNGAPLDLPTCKGLAILAKSGSHLDHFGAYMNANLEYLELEGCEPMMELKTLDLGASKGKNRKPVLSLLCQVFPKVVIQ